MGIGSAGFCDASGQQCSWIQELTLGPEFEPGNQVMVSGRRGQGVVLHTWDHRDRWLTEFEPSLVYLLSYRIARNT